MLKAHKSLNSVSIGFLEQVTTNVTAEAERARSKTRDWCYPLSMPIIKERELHLRISSYTTHLIIRIDIETNQVLWWQTLASYPVDG